ncbi:class I SAM-dependent methyltransferase [Aequorivita sp. H23M31]|uniref:Class I SAM-dependent methyltransferase n=1 Tax=Aequorivita ciconiae TaxID=2494375 RepID=A0A410FZC4_9FLAO|nr:class I SAM-dependent methyltransferase [Aequorivita sp. H23M31]QAA80367.1 class I SAM-dependent methyltransferase [Aequorivita sp. H23M31]
MKKIDYGIDAPKVIRRLLFIGILIISITLLFPIVSFGEIELVTSGFIWAGVSLIVGAILMTLYSKFGKLKHRDRILNKIQWTGSEKVLDVGTGLGLLMIGAAKRLTTGKAIGIDIFDSRDLSNNTLERTRANAKLEGVTGNTEVLRMDILKTDFPNDYFDVIVSNLCLHNIKKAKDRDAACAEIFRILKPEGKTIISDFINIGNYSRKFKSLGMKVQNEGTYLFDTFPPLTIIKSIKQ